MVIDGFSDILDKTTFDGVFVGNLSALALDTDGRVADHDGTRLISSEEPAIRRFTRRTRCWPTSRG